jgi:hypothetical protein
MLPYFFRHYRPLVERFVIFDDDSTDGSQELLSMQPDVQLGRFDRGDHSYVLSAVRFYREAWKASRGEADWVVVCNVDEHLYHRDLAGYLSRCRERGVTAVRAEGYEMVKDRFPDDPGRLCDSIVSGVRWDRLDKVALFDPSAIDEIGYAPGRHRAEPTGRVVYPTLPEVKLLHYKHLGVDYLLKRQAELRSRLLPGDVANRYGVQYLKDADAIRQDFDEVARAAVVVAN